MLPEVHNKAEIILLKKRNNHQIRMKKIQGWKTSHASLVFILTPTITNILHVMNGHILYKTTINNRNEKYV